MMHCKADFEEIFPYRSKPSDASVAADPLQMRSFTCLARWEVDGGRTRDRLAWEATSRLPRS